MGDVRNLGAMTPRGCPSSTSATKQQPHDAMTLEDFERALAENKSQETHKRRHRSRSRDRHDKVFKTAQFFAQPSCVAPQSSCSLAIG